MRKPVKSSGWSETVGAPIGGRTDISGKSQEQLDSDDPPVVDRLARGINNIGIESGACDWAMPRDTWSNVTFPPEVSPVIMIIYIYSQVLPINYSFTGGDCWSRGGARPNCVGFDSGRNLFISIIFTLLVFLLLIIIIMMRITQRTLELRRAENRLLALRRGCTVHKSHYLGGARWAQRLHLIFAQWKSGSRHTPPQNK